MAKGDRVLASSPDAPWLPAGGAAHVVRAAPGESVPAPTCVRDDSRGQERRDGAHRGLSLAGSRCVLRCLARQGLRAGDRAGPVASGSGRAQRAGHASLVAARGPPSSVGMLVSQVPDHPGDREAEACQRGKPDPRTSTACARRGHQHEAQHEGARHERGNQHDVSVAQDARIRQALWDWKNCL